MKLWVLSLSFKHAKLEERARATISDPAKRRELVEGLGECVWLVTCNRLEIYGVGETSPEQVRERWQKVCELNVEQSKNFIIHHGFQAVLHLFRVTASLESMVLGENQIHGQVKKSYLEAQESGSMGSILHRCFQSAFRAAKRVRSETEVGQFAVSVPSVGVKLAQKLLGSLATKTIGVIGLGEIGRIAAEHFASVGPKKLLLYNRTESVAHDFAAQLRTERVEAQVVSSLDPILEKAHIVVSAVDAVIIKAEQIARMETRSEMPFVLDLSAPPSIELGAAKALFVYGVDDLQRVAEENSQLREQELDKASKIVFGEAEKCWRGLETLTLGETFELLSEKVSTIKDRELEVLRKRLPHLSDGDWAEITKMGERLSRKIVQDPMMELRTRAEDESEKETWLHFFRNMFKI